MAAFTGGVSRTHKEFTPQSQTKPRREDRFATITGYDLSRSVLQVKDDDGRVIHVSINPEDIDRNNKSNAQKDIVADWFGHSIDEKMAKNLKPGARIVIEAASYSGKPIEADGQKIFVMRSSRIINVPNTEPEKAFKGLFSLDTRMITDEGVTVQRVVSVQAWDEEAVAIDDQAGLDKIRARIEEPLSEYGKIYTVGNGEEMAAVVPTIGVQFRARTATTEVNPQTTKEEYIVVDTSGCFDWIPAPRDEQGNILPGAKGHPLDVENLNVWIDGYKGHIENTFGEEAKNLKVEVCVYRNIAASPKSFYIKLSSSEKAPLNILANTITRLSQSESDEDNLARGKNWIVNGIVQISPNSLQKVGGKPTEIKRNYVQRLHANGIMGHVHAWVHAAGGGKCAPHAALKRVQKDKPAEAAPASAASAPAAKPEPSSAPVSQPAPAVSVPAASVSSAAAAEDWNPFDEKPGDVGAAAAAAVRRPPVK